MSQKSSNSGCSIDSEALDYIPHYDIESCQYTLSMSMSQADRQARNPGR